MLLGFSWERFSGRTWRLCESEWLRDSDLGDASRGDPDPCVLDDELSQSSPGLTIPSDDTHTCKIGSFFFNFCGEFGHRDLTRHSGARTQFGFPVYRSITERQIWLPNSEVETANPEQLVSISELGSQIWGSVVDRNFTFWMGKPEVSE